MKLPNSVAELDDFVRKNGFRPVGKWTYKEMEIYVAESDLVLNKPQEYPWGYYMTTWFVANPIRTNNEVHKFDVGSWVEFDAFHDAEKGWTRETKRQARIGPALTMAQDWIDKNLEVERYA